MTALHWSSKRGHIEIVDFLIRKGAYVNQEDCVKKKLLNVI